MGRVRGKGKRQAVVVVGDDNESGEEEKLLVKRRGRPQKPIKDDLEGAEHEAVEKKENNGSEETASKSGPKNQAGVENGRKRKRKRKRTSPVKENGDPVEEENGVETRTNAADLMENIGYRQNGSRRKNKPRRAAEVGVECK